MFCSSIHSLDSIGSLLLLIVCLVFRSLLNYLCVCLWFNRLCCYALCNVKINSSRFWFPIYIIQTTYLMCTNSTFLFPFQSFLLIVYNILVLDHFFLIFVRLCSFIMYTITKLCLSTAVYIYSFYLFI